MPYSKRLTTDDERFLSVDELQKYHQFSDAAYGNDMLSALIYNETLVTVTQRRLRHALAERDALRSEVSQLRHDLATLRALAMQNKY